MSIVSEERRSDSPYVEAVTRGRTESDGSTVRPAESRWHLVVVRHAGAARALAVGPLTGSGVASWEAGAEILWIRFSLGTFMPHLPTRTLLDTETVLPDASSRSFWLGGSAWPFPDHENADAFVERLVREGVLARDPVLCAASAGLSPQGLSPRTLRHRFLRAAGLAQGAISQIDRANRAAACLRRGVSIPDVVHEAGYFDQAHMTRSLKRWVGGTPARIATARRPE
ncbi:MAG TPA: helix-turn-helix domain-containing protein [Rubrobacter sp.]|nr:helix-turn-helix domain-containing protein [Rubrobacter sp.]